MAIASLVAERHRIGGLGICASAGYMVDATVQSQEIKSVALIAPWLHNREIVNQVYGGEASVQNLIDISRQAQAQYEATGELSLVPAASDTDETAVMQQAPYYTDPNRGAIPEYVNQFNLASWEGWLTYDAVALAPSLEDPLMMIHSEAAAIPQGAKEFYRLVSGQKNKLWLENTTQFDFYDSPQSVATASDAVDQHFRQTL